jgi:hypothetical protein
MQPGLFGRHLGLLHQTTFVRQIAAGLSNEAFSPVGLGLAAAGIFWPLHSRVATLFRLWVLGAAIVLLSVPEVLPANLYYLAALLPGGAALAGLALASLPTRAWPARLVALAGLTVAAVWCTLPLYTPDRSPYDLGMLLERLSSKDDLLLTESGGSPNVLYYANRRGWMVGGLYNPAMADRLVGLGARYYANAFGSVVEGKAFFGRLDQLFERLTGEGAPWPIYDLSSAARARATTDIQAPLAVNFGNQIEFCGISSRRLLESPASFDLILHWRCLKTPEADVNGFVHVVDSVGKTVYQEDHWRGGRRPPIRQWKPGEVIDERYILVLPAALRAAKYELRLGWYEPVHQTRVSIVGDSDGQERATVAEVETLGPRSYRWLDVR